MNSTETNILQSSTDTVILNIGGMSCDGCVNRIQNSLKNRKGIYEATANLTTTSANIVFNPEIITQDKFKLEIEKLGYKILSEKHLDEPNKSNIPR